MLPRSAIFLFPLLVSLSAGVAAAGERIHPKAWPRVKVYTMQELKQHTPPLREYVGVRFHYRHETIRKLRPTWYQGSIWSHSGDAAQGNLDYIPVLVAAKDLEAFRRLPTDFRTAKTSVVYGQVLRDADANWTFIRLIGTKLTEDRDGYRVVTW